MDIRFGRRRVGQPRPWSARAEHNRARPRTDPRDRHLTATTISGYVDTSAVWNPGTGNANPAPYAFNTPANKDGFNLDSADVKLSKVADDTTSGRPATC